ncbi:PREDICTED: SLC2A4 regulator [Chrysochloris asiatica]|uniref:SLC2A4 regulator n=1 Tax=Chrysochloris asiatica TaxID=185453 RepID=A0A9B0U4N2_CHRAS|nr:PREDICTED: SLC2A4 regulator [Chrysochloris asiatica]
MEAARPPAPGLGCGCPPPHAASWAPAAVSGPSAQRDEAPRLRPEGAVPIAAPRTGPALPPQGPAVGDGFAGLELALPPEARALDLWVPGSWVGVAPGPQSAHIPVPVQRSPPGRVRLDEVMAATALTSLSTSPLLLGAPAAAFSSEPSLEPWPENLGQLPDSYDGSSNHSGDWDLASYPASPSTPSPPLPLEAAHFLFGEPTPRKRKNSAQVMFQCLWKSCGKVLSSASGMQRHIRVVHLGRQAEPEQSDGEEDFYYTELDIGVDALSDGLSSLTPVSPTASLPPVFPRLDLPEPSALPPTPILSQVVSGQVCHIHSDHAYQGCLDPMHLEPQPPTVRACFTPALPSKLAANPRKPRGDAKKCRKVYGMDHRELWCMACRWKKACQRFLD